MYGKIRRFTCDRITIVYLPVVYGEIRTVHDRLRVYTDSVYVDLGIDLEHHVNRDRHDDLEHQVNLHLLNQHLHYNQLLHLDNLVLSMIYFCNRSQISISQNALGLSSNDLNFLQNSNLLIKNQ